MKKAENSIAQTESASPTAKEVNITGPHAVFFNGRTTGSVASLQISTINQIA